MIEEQDIIGAREGATEIDLPPLVFERRPDADSESALTTPIQTASVNPRIEFREGQFVFCMTNEAGGLVERFISAAQVKQAFTGVPIDTAWMAPGIVRWGNGRLGEWAVGFVPPQVHEIEITRETVADVNLTTGERTQQIGTSPAIEHSRIRVPLPGLVWFGHGTTYFIWAVKTDGLDPYREIYRAPLPNTYASGEICWGVVKPERMTGASFFKAYDLFMGSTFNNHLANAKSKRFGDDVRLMLREVADAYARVPEIVQPVEMEAGPIDFEAPSVQLPPLPEVQFVAPKYPVDDLMRQVPHSGVTLDQAIRNYFEVGEMPA